MKLLKIVGGAFACLILLLLLTFAGARFHDGPLGLIPGGPLVSGELASGVVADWSFAESIDVIELQLEGESTSRTTWILVSQGRAFIPCSLGFPPGKRWHLQADRDGRAIIRVRGQRYPVLLERLLDGVMAPELKAIIGAKYGGGPPSDAGVWFFSVQSRPF